MEVYPSAHRVMANLDGVWTDITSYVIEDITGSWGIQGNGPLDFLADTGTIRITLNNMDQRFTPGHPSALAGWKKGIPIKLEIVFDTLTYPMLGTIDDIDIPLGSDWVDKAFVTMQDWLEYSARDPIVNPGVLTDQRGNQVIEIVLGMMPIQPAATELDEGINIFPTTFDTVTSHTRAYSEFGKVAFSELGYLYLKKDRVYGETLVFESAHARHGWRALDPLPLISSESGFLLKEDGGALLLEDGGHLLLDQTETLFVDNAMLDLQSDYGRQVLNYFTAQANPRRIDSSPQILFQLDQPVPIASGQTVTIKGSYADPAGGQPINAQNMITPVITTDYLVNTKKNGSGTNISANLTLVSISYGTEGFTHQVRNDGSANGWITKYNTRGYGIYLYNPIEHIATDQGSIDEFGTQTETLDQKYQTELASGRLYTAKIVERDHQPRTVLRSITCLANHSPTLMQAFLNFGPGNLIRIASTRRNIDSYFYIQGVADFKLSQGGLIMFTWIVKSAPSLLLGLSALAIEFNSNLQYVDFDYVPYLIGLERKTYSAWVYLAADSWSSPYTRVILSFYADAASGNFLEISQGSGADFGKPVFGQHFSVSNGQWRTNVDYVTGHAEEWIHIVVSYDASSATNDPIMYINGASVAITEFETPSGTIDEGPNPLEIGNFYHPANGDHRYGFPGRLRDVRIYDRMLSSDEVSALYNGGTPEAALVTEGLKFQAFAVRTEDLADYIDATLDADDKLLDNFNGLIGTPQGGPVGRAW
jgi:hypothetical protein